MSTSDYTAGRPVASNRLSRQLARAGINRIFRYAWLVGGLTLLAAVIRFATIAKQSFWMDEALTSYEAHESFVGMLKTVAHVETTPPLYFILVWGWAKLFGTGEAGLRSFSAIAGVGIVPIVYLCGREVLSRRAGVISAALAAVNPFLVWYSQEARAYILLAALSGASFLWFLRAHRDPSRRALVWWGIASSLALATHYFAGFLVAPEAVWLVWIHRTRAVRTTVALVAAVQAALIPLALLDTSHGLEWIHAISLSKRVGEIPLQFGTSTIYRHTTTTVGLIAGALFIAVVALLLGRASDAQTRRGARLAGGIAAAVLLAPLMLRFIGPDVFLARNLIPAWIPLVVLFAAACVAPRGRMLGLTLALSMAALFAYATVAIQTSPELQRTPWRSVARLLGHAGVPRAILAGQGDTANPLKLYLRGVAWVQPHRRQTVVREIDVVGSSVPTLLVPPASLPWKHGKPPVVLGKVLPALAPSGARLISSSRYGSFAVARFALVHPELVDVDRLEHQIAARFFRRTPLYVNGFVAPE